MELPYAKKSLGQHWLTDGAALASIADAADLQSDDVVLEIGPGLGTLTEVVGERVAKVVAVEFDEKLARELPGRVKAVNMEVVHSDILKFNLTSMPPDYKVVANIPYYLTSNLIRVLSESANQPKTAVILVQKEVARRVAAEPGDMSILSVTAQYYWQVALGDEVPARLFTPPPKVDSQVLVLKRREAPLFPGTDVKQYFQVVKAGFSQRRKTLLNSLSGGLRLGKPEISEALSRAGLSAGARAQTLSLEEWHALYRALYT